MNLSKARHTEVPWDEIDEGVVDLVRTLVDAGIPTTGSCEGGSEHAFDVPTVILDGSGLVPSLLRERAVDALLAAEYRGFTVKEVYYYQGEEKAWRSHVVVELWTNARN